jgi:hypothetical protein
MTQRLRDSKTQRLKDSRDYHQAQRIDEKLQQDRGDPQAEDCALICHNGHDDKERDGDREADCKNATPKPARVGKLVVAVC